MNVVMIYSKLGLHWNYSGPSFHFSRFTPVESMTPAESFLTLLWAIITSTPIIYNIFYIISYDYCSPSMKCSKPLFCQGKTLRFRDIYTADSLIITYCYDTGITVLWINPTVQCSEFTEKYKSATTIKSAPVKKNVLLDHILHIINWNLGRNHIKRSKSCHPLNLYISILLQQKCFLVMYFR